MRWSISKLHVYEGCAYRYKLKYIDKVPEPERPLPPGKTEHANDRGSRVHEQNELFVRDETDKPAPESADFQALIEDLRERFRCGLVMLEHDWCFNEDWEPCSPEERAAIAIVDVAVWIVKDRWLLIIDYKTGRKYETKHMDQMQLYALAAFKKWPFLERVTTELWYLDIDEISTSHFTRNHIPAIQRAFHNRVGKMERNTEFKPAANIYSCRYCPYKDGICPHAVDEKTPVKGNEWASEWKI